MRHGTLCTLLILAPALVWANDDAGGPISALAAIDVEFEATLVALADVDADVPMADAAAETEAVELAVEIEESRFWLGIDCEAPAETLRSQLGLAADSGLVIVAVADASPAAKSGLQTDDVVAVAKLGEDEYPISSVEQFSELVQQAETNPIELTVFRDGKSTAVQVTPGERPGVTVVKFEKGDKPRALPGRKPSGRKPGLAGNKTNPEARKSSPMAKKGEGKPGRRHGAGARHHRGDHKHAMSQHGRGGWGRHHGSHGDHGRTGARGDSDREHRGRQHAARGQRGRKGDHGKMSQHRGGRHPRHMAHRGPQHRFGRMAMRGHGRPGGFGHSGMGHGGFGRGGMGQGHHFGSRFAMALRGGKFDHSRMAMFHQLMQRRHGSDAHAKPAHEAKTSSNVESRLEALITRLEKAAGPQALGRFGAASSPGFGGGFRPPFATQRRDGDRPESNRPGQRPGSRPGTDRPEPQRREASAEPASLDQMRSQLRQLQEQQEHMMRAIRELAKAVKKSTQK